MILGAQGSWTPIHMHQMDCQGSPPRCRRLPGFSLPTRRATHGRQPNQVRGHRYVTFISFWGGDV